MSTYNGLANLLFDGQQSTQLIFKNIKIEYLLEYGGWQCNESGNRLRVGGELIAYIGSHPHAANAENVEITFLDGPRKGETQLFQLGSQIQSKKATCYNGVLKIHIK